MTQLLIGSMGRLTSTMIGCLAPSRSTRIPTELLSLIPTCFSLQQHKGCDWFSSLQFYSISYASMGEFVSKS
jgi:hypothetical protein